MTCNIFVFLFLPSFVSCVISSRDIILYVISHVISHVLSHVISYVISSRDIMICYIPCYILRYIQWRYCMICCVPCYILHYIQYRYYDMLYPTLYPVELSYDILYPTLYPVEVFLYMSKSGSFYPTYFLLLNILAKYVMLVCWL